MLFFYIVHVLPARGSIDYSRRLEVRPKSIWKVELVLDLFFNLQAHHPSPFPICKFQAGFCELLHKHPICNRPARFAMQSLNPICVRHFICELRAALQSPNPICNAEPRCSLQIRFESSAIQFANSKLRCSLQIQFATSKPRRCSLQIRFANSELRSSKSSRRCFEFCKKKFVLDLHGKSEEAACNLSSLQSPVNLHSLESQFAISIQSPTALPCAATPPNCCTPLRARNRPQQ
jgi:hypothetical protein